MSGADPLRLGAAEAARRLARRELSAESMVRACLDRIAARESEVRAWTVVDADGALAQARALDAGAVRGLLHGLPIGVKDLMDTAALPTAYGSPIYAGHQPRADAAAVALCREAGAIVLGKTVTTEFATFNPGPTRNPCAPAGAPHTPGGSSSGSAAAVADAMVPLAFGTQTAGSVIRPAAFCGIVGYKPSFGKIARAGVKGLSDTLDTIGSFGRSVDDAALLVAAASGDTALAALTPDAERTRRWGVIDIEAQAALPETRAWLAKAPAALGRLGERVVDVPVPASFAGLTAAQTVIMAFEAAQALAHERVAHGAQLSPGLRDLLDAGHATPYEAYRDARQIARIARRSLDATLFAHADFVLAASAAGEAPAGLDRTGDPLFCRLWTLLGLPCVHLPLGLGPHGLPVGLQLIGREGQDRALLDAAAWLLPRLRETAAGGGA